MTHSTDTIISYYIYGIQLSEREKCHITLGDKTGSSNAVLLFKFLRLIQLYPLFFASSNLSMYPFVSLFQVHGHFSLVVESNPCVHKYNLHKYNLFNPDGVTNTYMFSGKTIILNNQFRGLP